MTIAELIAVLNLDFVDQATPKASRAARSLEKSLRNINIEGAIRGDPFSKTYKYFDRFRSTFEKTAKDIGQGFKLDLGRQVLSYTPATIKNLDKVAGKFEEAKDVALSYSNSIKNVSRAYELLQESKNEYTIENFSRAMEEARTILIQFRQILPTIKFPDSISADIRANVIPTLERMIKIASTGSETSTKGFLDAAKAIEKFNLSSRIAEVGIAKLRVEYEKFVLSTESFTKRRAIGIPDTKDLIGQYSQVLSNINRTRAQLSNTLGLLRSNLEFIPRIASSVRSQITSLAQQGYDLTVQDIRNIKSVVDYRKIELQALQVRSNLIRAGLASESEVVDLIKKASLFAQKYNLSLGDVLKTLKISEKDWFNFYANSLKSGQAIDKIKAELEIINTLIRKGTIGYKSITTEVLVSLRSKKKELELELELQKATKSRLSSLSQMVRYYDLMEEKARMTLGSKMDADLRKTIGTIAEINTQLQAQYKIQENISKLRRVIAESYAQDIDASKLLEVTGINREKVEEAIAVAKERTIAALETQYELGILNSREQAKLRDELLAQDKLTRKQQLILGEINTKLSSEETAYNRILREQAELNRLLEAQKQYLTSGRLRGAGEAEVRDARKTLLLMQDRKKVLDEIVRRVEDVGDYEDRAVKSVQAEIEQRLRSQTILTRTTNEQIRQLTTNISQIKTLAELRAREQQILKILREVTKYIENGGKLTTRWANNTKQLESALGRVRANIRKTEQASGGLGSTVEGAASALRGFLNLRLVGVFLLYRTMWELRRVFSDLAGKAIELEDKMKKFEAITLASSDAVKLATSTVITLSEQYALAATDIADALIKIGQAGYSAQESIGLITSVSQLAVATGSELSDTVNLMLSAMSAWNLETANAADVANIFTSAINSTRLTVEKLNTAFNYVTGIAPQMNITLEETAAVLGTMADAGIRASTSGTSFRAMLAELTRPSQRVVKTLHDLGLSIEDVDPQLHTLTEILVTLKNAGFTAADAFRAFGRRGASGISVLVANAEKVGELSTSFNNYARAASLAAIASESLQARLTIFWNRLRAGVAESVPFITKFIDTLGGMRSIEISGTGTLQFSKTLGEIILEAQSTEKRVKELAASFRDFIQAVQGIRSLEQAGLYMQALTKAYRAGLIPLETYNKLMKEHNNLLQNGGDNTDHLARVQSVLNNEMERAVEIEKRRRLLGIIDAIDKESKASAKLKEKIGEQNDEIAKNLGLMKDYKAAALIGGIQAISPVLGAIIADYHTIDQGLSDIQKILGTDLADEWVKSLREQDVAVTGLTKDMSKHLYEIVTVVKYGSKEMAKDFIKSGKSLEDYRKSIIALSGSIKETGGLSLLNADDLKNIMELSRYPKLFTLLASNMDTTTLSTSDLVNMFEKLRGSGVVTGNVIDTVINSLKDTEIQSKALSTTIGVLQKQFSDYDKDMKIMADNYIRTASATAKLTKTTLLYSQAMERMALARKLTSSAYVTTDVSEELKLLKEKQAKEAIRTELDQQKQLVRATAIGVAQRLNLLQAYYNKLVSLAKGNARVINDLNTWRKDQELRIYKDLTVAAERYKNQLERYISSESNKLDGLYAKLAQLDQQLASSAADSEQSIKEFDTAVKTKLDKVRGIVKSSADLLDKQRRDVQELVDKAYLASTKLERDIYYKQAKTALDKLKSSFLSAKDLSASQIEDFGKRIREMMENLQVAREDQLREEKQTVQKQIDDTERSLREMANNLKNVTKVLQQAFDRKGKITFETNLENELEPKFNEFLTKIEEANPQLQIDHNLDSVTSKLEGILALLNDIKSTAGSINIPTTPSSGKATGGFIPGYGGGDIVPTWLEPGEFIIRKEVVKDYGLEFFRNLNRGIAINNNFPRMRFGGVIQETKPKEMVTINLNLGGTAYPLLGEKDVVDSFISHLEKERMMTI